MFNPIPLKKVFSREEEITWEITNAMKARNKNKGLDFSKASLRSLNSTFLDTRYKERPVIEIFNRVLTMFQIFFFSIKNTSNLVCFSVCAFKIGTHVNFC